MYIVIYLKPFVPVLLFWDFLFTDTSISSTCSGKYEINDKNMEVAHAAHQYMFLD